MRSGILLFLGALLCLGLNTAYSQLSSDDNLKSVVPPPMDYVPFTNPFDDPVTINGFDNFYLGVDFGEPHIVTNPNDPLNSICAFNTNGVHYTLDGENWQRVTVSFPGFSVVGDPVLAFDSLGVCHYIQIFQNGSTYGLVVTKSTNKGASWSGVSQVVGTTVGLTDKEWITADRSAGPYSNNLYVGWRQFGTQSGMRFVKSTNSGATWSSSITFADGSQGAYVCVGPGGAVYFAYTGGSSNYVRVSTDGGSTFSGPTNATGFFNPAGNVCAGRQTVKNCIRTNQFPRMAVDNSYTSSRGNIYMVFEVNPPGADIADVNFVRSTNGGVSWSTPVRVNDDATTTDQWMEAIDVDSKTGKIFISWFDSREDPTNNLMTKVYGTVSTDGGLTFTTNEAISNAEFNPNNMAVGQGGGQANYIGDYFGISAIGHTSYAVWMDGRNNSLGSYVGYYPDFAMTTDKDLINIGNNQTQTVTVKGPGKKGPFTGGVKFNAVIDTLPASGSINFSFQNGKDSITAFPDSVKLDISTVGTVTPGLYNVKIYGKGTTNGTPVHKRTVSLLVNSSVIGIQTNRGTAISYTVNGTPYNTQHDFVFANGSNVTISAPPFVESGSTKYVFTNWSNSGDTTQILNISQNLDLTASYKAQYKLLVNTTQGNTFGGNAYYDSAGTFQFGVTSTTVINGNDTFYFRGWSGLGIGAYTSSDSTGQDDTVSWTMSNPIVEIARWSDQVGIVQIGSEIPEKFELYQNYPNPFNPETIIRYDIPKNGNVSIVIYDMLGKEVTRLVDRYQNAGRYEVNFDGSGFSSGIYFYRISTGDFVQVRRMILVK
ncbi:MAG: T9SS type A sorting domain-containing protein [Ignavibacteriae bacterium]|nr:T9SS type A sorting domain-containing protein [Ignavibacteriota bacterium]MCB9244282.1 T9SS type A sorting domain-containing protein [Ignavibacteriales bacterium]